MDAIVDSYADLLNKRPNTGYIIRDIGELPYPREIIREAILDRLQIETDFRARQAIKGAYVALACFQALTSEERKALKIMSELEAPNTSLEQTEVLAKRMNAVLPLHSAVMERFSTELKAFAQDMAKLAS